ncbi:MAG: hypothetical protein KGJ13_02470 [Patescibacteria group bacterium]|nr:hypothetical protein [Patescibacteria group bacterium]
MAIIIEEEKTSSNIISFLGWISVIVILVVAVYYIFLITPPVAIIAPPGNLQAILSVSGQTQNPQDILGNTVYQSLKQYVPAPTPTGPGAVGRPNPFVSP